MYFKNKSCYDYDQQNLNDAMGLDQSVRAASRLHILCRSPTLQREVVGDGGVDAHE